MEKYISTLVLVLLIDPSIPCTVRQSSDPMKSPSIPSRCLGFRGPLH